MNKDVVNNATSVYKGLRLVAGMPALDLLNTVKYRGRDNDGDRLLEFSDIVDWSKLVNLINDTEAERLTKHQSRAEKKNVFNEIIKLRENFRLFVETQELDFCLLEKAYKSIEKTIAELQAKVVINRKTGILEKTYPIKSPKDLKDRVVSSIEELLQNRDKIIIKTCAGIDCDWVFADKTKAKRRKWCDTSTCGNLARVRKHRSGARDERH